MATTTTTFTVLGMTCDHCRRAVHDEVAGIDGVTGVEVDLDGGKVTITSAGPLDPTAVAEAVDEAGYEVAP